MPPVSPQPSPPRPAPLAAAKSEICLGAASLNTTPLAFAENARIIVSAITRAKQAGVEVLCLPELCVSGYGCEDAFLRPETAHNALEAIAEILPHTAGIAVTLGFPVWFQGAIYNATALASGGALWGVYAKHNLAGDGLHYEPRWFKAWPAGVRSEITLGDQRIAFGELCFELEGLRFGFEVCEEAWVMNRQAERLAAQGADVILSPSASHFALGKRGVRRRILQETSRAFGVAYVYTNLLGNEAGRVIYDGDASIAANGSIVAEAERLSFAEYQLVSARVDCTRARAERAANHSFTPSLDAASAAIILPTLSPQASASLSTASGASWEHSEQLAFEEFARAAALGLFDYLRKSQAKGFVVSLSGGADSAAVACLVALMVQFGASELGLGELKRRLSHIPALVPLQSVPECVQALLTTAYQSTRNSSETTRAAAAALAEALPAKHVEFAVDELVQKYVQLAEAALGRKLSWETDDAALQNIQARVRAPSVWLLANVEQKLLLATSNRSEVALGYATMDGDTAGGLAPIAGIDKPFIRRFLVWLEQAGPAGARIPALQHINALAPTAELRPLGENQTDETDLMPYELLEWFEEALFRTRLSLATVRKQAEQAFPALEAAQLDLYFQRFLRLFAQNQWKRERYAPALHMDQHNLDPRSWLRFPILSGGFQQR